MYSRILVLSKADVKQICNIVEIGLNFKERNLVFYIGEKLNTLGAKLWWKYMKRRNGKVEKIT
jgi:hypothetical protein